MSRVEITDTVSDMMVKMSDGNPGALTTMMVMLQESQAIDPQMALGGLGTVMLLDTWEIYGSGIYVLYNDKCDRDLRKMVLLIRATQLGKFPHNKLKEMADDQCREINLTEEEWKELDEYVCNELTEFKRP